MWNALVKLTCYFTCMYVISIGTPALTVNGYQKCLAHWSCWCRSTCSVCAKYFLSDEPNLYDTGSHSNHVPSSKWVGTLICHTTMRRNPINIIYNSGHVTLWCVEVGPVANAREGSTQEHDRARVILSISIRYYKMYQFTLNIFYLPEWIFTTQVLRA